MTPRRLVKLPALVASACLVAIAVQAQTVSDPSLSDDARGQRFTNPPAPPWGTADLERQYWRCDHASASAFLGFETAARCSLVYEDLLKLRFGGDFAAFLAWWRGHKAAERAALDASTAATATARSGPGPTAQAAGPLDGATPEQLKAAYLHCDRLAITEHFDSGAAHACSIVFEALKARVFGGSTDRFIAWMQQQAALRDRAGPGERP